MVIFHNHINNADIGKIISIESNSIIVMFLVADIFKKINKKNDINFEDVMTNITAFLKPLYDSIAYEIEFQKE